MNSTILSFILFCIADFSLKVSNLKVIVNVLYIKINSFILFISTKNIFFSSFSSTPSAENELYLFKINLIKASLFSLSIEDFNKTSIIL